MTGEVAERFIRTLKNKTYRYITSISENVYINTLDSILNECINAYDGTIKINHIDVKDNTYINIGKEVNDKDPKFKVRDQLSITNHKHIFAKGCTPNWSEEGFVIKKVKTTVPWTYVISDLDGDEIIGIFY